VVENSECRAGKAEGKSQARGAADLISSIGTDTSLKSSTAASRRKRASNLPTPHHFVQIELVEQFFPSP
jgi:hypothetical protein